MKTTILPRDPIATAAWRAIQKREDARGPSLFELLADDGFKADAGPMGYLEVLLQRRLIEQFCGVRSAPIGQPRTRRATACINCGAPFEPVCSYCGSVA